VRWREREKIESESVPVCVCVCVFECVHAIVYAILVNIHVSLNSIWENRVHIYIYSDCVCYSCEYSRPAELYVGLFG